MCHSFLREPISYEVLLPSENADKCTVVQHLQQGGRLPAGRAQNQQVATGVSGLTNSLQNQLYSTKKIQNCARCKGSD